VRAAAAMGESRRASDPGVSNRPPTSTEPNRPVASSREQPSSAAPAQEAAGGAVEPIRKGPAAPAGEAAIEPIRRGPATVEPSPPAKKQYTQADNDRRYNRYKRKVERQGRESELISREAWDSKWANKPGPNPGGAPGKSDHQAVVKREAERLRQLYPDKSRYAVHEGESIKKMKNAEGLDRRPDVWVEDRVNRRVIKIIEVGRTDRQNQERENAKTSSTLTSGSPANPYCWSNDATA
jgi:hypothetical protein